jgi:hypothetical protein
MWYVMFWTKPYSKTLLGPKNSMFFSFFFSLKQFSQISPKNKSSDDPTHLKSPKGHIKKVFIKSPVIGLNNR